VAAVGESRLEKSSIAVISNKGGYYSAKSYVARAANRPYGYGREELPCNLW